MLITRAELDGAFSAVVRFIRYNPQRASIALALVIVLFGVVDHIVYLNSTEGRAEAAREQANEDQRRAQAWDQTLIDIDLAGVKGSLRDPDSAQFSGTRHIRRDGKDVTCGLVNARNGFGGMAGYESFAVVDGLVSMSSAGLEDARRVEHYCG